MHTPKTAATDQPNANSANKLRVGYLREGFLPVLVDLPGLPKVALSLIVSATLALSESYRTLPAIRQYSPPLQLQLPQLEPVYTKCHPTSLHAMRTRHNKSQSSYHETQNQVSSPHHHNQF